MTILSVTLTDGTVLSIDEDEYWNVRSRFQRKMQAHTFMRVGDFHIAIGDSDLAVYEQATPEIPPVWTTPEMLRDRVHFQMPAIEKALWKFHAHPFAARIAQAVLHEISEWDKSLDNEIKERAKTS